MFKRTVLFLVLLCGMPYISAQDALTSVKLNLCHVKLSPDAKSILFDIYVQGVNKDTLVVVPGYLFRLSIPQADIGSSEKVVTITNKSKELGCTVESMVAFGTDWLMRLTYENMVVSYGAALVAKTDYPGSLIGSVKISNSNNSLFPNPITVKLAFSGTGVKTKTTCSVFRPNTTTLAPNSTVPLPASNFSGLDTYTLYASGKTTGINPPSISNENEPREMRVFDLYGRFVVSAIVRNQTEINLSSLPNGIYIVEDNGNRKKYYKK